MTISQHLQAFAGLPVFNYEPGRGLDRGPPGGVAYRLIAVDRLAREEDQRSFPELLDQYLAEPGAEGTTALVVGAWGEGMYEGGNSHVIAALVAARERLPRLRALFLGDITFEECEISWITQGDVSPLLAAYPELEEFRVRGVGGLTLGHLRHPSLRVLAMESGGLPAGILEELWTAELPKLEHLELWLGTPNYGGIDSPAPLEPLLAGRVFPWLSYLGLRNSDIADAVAAAVAASSVLQRIPVLDLSLGNLSDEGARALIASPALRRLRRLDIHHHYVSAPVVAQLQGLGIEVDAGDAKEPESSTYGGVTETYRYNAVSE
jgi:hypothetical protein